ncbi:MAG: FecCD family ABC transporter permease [Candidatus Entotheonellia bacterium]
MGFLGGQRRFERSAEGTLPRDDVGTSVAATGVTPWAEQSVLTSQRWVTTMLTLTGASLLVMIASLRFGAEEIGFADLARILFQAFRYGETGIDSFGSSSVILLQVRLPRVLLGFMVGSCLAAVGVGLQALLRNPLADPYVLGISSGAALGAAVAMLVGFGKTMLALSAISLCAFLGGLFSLVVVYRIALSYGHLPVHTLLLAGVILNAIFSALIMFITSTMNPNRSFGMMSWLMGTLTAPDYPALIVLTVYLFVGGLILFMQTRPLNILTLGEESARSLGVEVERVKKTVFFTSALLTGAVVSVSGLIGFVGMVIPHAVRMVIGPDHRLLLPASALVGGIFLLAADTAARTLLAPAEIPVGVITALAGGPFFIYLLMSRKGGLAR